MENVMRRESFSHFVAKLSGIQDFLFKSENGKTIYRFKSLYYDEWSGQGMVRLLSFDGDMFDLPDTDRAVIPFISFDDYQNDNYVPDRVVVPVYFLYRNDFLYNQISKLWLTEDEKEAAESAKKEG